MRKVRKHLKKWFAPNFSGEITPDEIFLDASNLPGFDVDQFEGRLEKPISQKAINFVFLAFVLLGLAFSYRLWFLQVTEGKVYLERGESNRLRYNHIFSNRGVIYDRQNKELAFNVFLSEESDFAKRQYTSSLGLSHVLGYVKYPTKDRAGFYWETSYVGKSGVEGFYSDILTGENGLEIVETDALDNIQTQNIVRPPKEGENLYLALDSSLQSQFWKIIADAAIQFNYEGGAGAMIDVETGEILSLVSFPEYNSEILSDGKDAQKIEEYQKDPRKPFLNRVVSGLYSPGSIVKPFLAAAALNEGLIDPSKKILSTGSLSVPNPYFPGQFSIFNDWKAHGWVNMFDALAVSSNVYFYQIGGGFEDQKGLGITKIESYLRNFGFGEMTGIDLPGEVGGVIPNPEWKRKKFQGDDWRLGDTYNTSIGQYGFQVTPIQVLKSVAVLANGGRLLEPTLLNGGKSQEPKLVNINPEALRVAREGMREAVKRGTARGLSVPYLEVAAKTGTAEIGKSLVNSWVVGFFPFEKPRYAFVVVMERGPRANTIGGVYVMRQLLDWMSTNTPEYFK